MCERRASASALVAGNPFDREALKRVARQRLRSKRESRTVQS